MLINILRLRLTVFHAEKKDKKRWLEMNFVDFFHEYSRDPLEGKGGNAEVVAGVPTKGLSNSFLALFNVQCHEIFASILNPLRPLD